MQQHLDIGLILVKVLSKDCCRKSANETADLNTAFYSISIFCFMLNMHSCQTDLILKIMSCNEGKERQNYSKTLFQCIHPNKRTLKKKYVAVFYLISSSPFYSYVILYTVFYTPQKPMTFFAISLLVCLLPFNKKYFLHNNNNNSKSSYLLWTKKKKIEVCMEHFHRQVSKLKKHTFLWIYIDIIEMGSRCCSVTKSPIMSIKCIFRKL